LGEGLPRKQGHVLSPFHGCGEMQCAAGCSTFGLCANRVYSNTCFQLLMRACIPSSQMFELADMWCPSIEASAYAKLLRTIRFRLTRVVVQSRGRGNKKRRLKAVVRKVTPEEAERLRRERAKSLRGRPGDIARYLGKPPPSAESSSSKKSRGRSPMRKSSSRSASNRKSAPVREKTGMSEVSHKKGGQWERPWRKNSEKLSHSKSQPASKRGTQPNTVSFASKSGMLSGSASSSSLPPPPGLDQIH